MQATLGSGTVCTRHGIIGQRKFRSTSFGLTPQDPSTLHRLFAAPFPLLFHFSTVADDKPGDISRDDPIGARTAVVKNISPMPQRQRTTKLATH